jgi:creatinine amidohydrolase/Fe(II)-dependent formamide hydrolase-like protein
MVSKNPLLIIVVGSLEQHGRHLPLGTDVVIPMGIAEWIGQQTPALIPPPIRYGILSGNMYAAGHASYLETLALLAVRPELVDLSELKPSKADHEVRYEIAAVDNRALPKDGVTWPSDERLKSMLTPQLAEAALNGIVNSTLRAVQEELT